MCSPANHPVSFRCSLHKKRKQEAIGGGNCRLGAKRMGSPLVGRTGAIERAEKEFTAVNVIVAVEDDFQLAFRIFDADTEAPSPPRADGKAT